jgi:hypothetical protein
VSFFKGDREAEVRIEVKEMAYVVIRRAWCLYPQDNGEPLRL